MKKKWVKIGVFGVESEKPTKYSLETMFHSRENPTQQAFHHA
jgi:hypothetical protein